MNTILLLLSISCVWPPLTQTKSNRRRQSVALHLEAYVDLDRLARLESQGLRSSLGKFTEDGFVQTSNVFKIWRPAQDSTLHRFNLTALETHGIVGITRSGYYNIYAQVLFHGSSASNQFGIHVNDPVVPIVEAFSFRIISHLELHKTQYVQCSTTVVRYLRAGDRVFIKTPYSNNRPVVPERALTFWGMYRV